MRSFLKMFAAFLLAMVVLVTICGFALTRYRSLAITNSTIDSTVIGGTTPATGSFIGVNSSGLIAGNGGVKASGTGLKHIRVGTCTTTTGSTGSCGATITWPSAWVDTNYTAVCSLDAASSIGLQGTTAKTTTGISYAIYNVNGNTAAQAGIINCVGMHD